jgi:gluconate 5-dehydrogenase
MPNVFSGDYNNIFDIAGKKAVVVGGAGGFGKEIAKALAQRGVSVLISSRRESALVEACKEIEAVATKGAKVTYFAGDAGDEETVKAMLAYTVSAEGLGGCDILVNSQGYNKKMWSWEIDTTVWNGMLNTNITSLMFTCKYFGNWMKNNNLPEGVEKVPEDQFESGKATPNQGFGKIVNIGSVRGIRAVANGGNGNVPYNTTKGAVEMLTKAFAADLRPNIQVNLVGPTITYTPMMVGLLPADEKVRNGIAASQPAMRIGYESDIVGTVLYLVSPAADFVTSNSIYPDGGLVATS